MLIRRRLLLRAQHDPFFVRITFEKDKVGWIRAPQRGAVEGISVSFLTAVIQ